MAGPGSWGAKTGLASRWPRRTRHPVIVSPLSGPDRVLPPDLHRHAAGSGTRTAAGGKGDVLWNGPPLLRVPGYGAGVSESAEMAGGF